MNYVPKINRRKFVIGTAAAGLGGTEFTTELLPTLSGGLFFDVAYGSNSVALEVAGILGDYNLDGTVDAADYTVWRDNYGATSPGAGSGSVAASVAVAAPVVVAPVEEVTSQQAAELSSAAAVDDLLADGVQSSPLYEVRAISTTAAQSMQRLTGRSHCSASQQWHTNDPLTAQRDLLRGTDRVRASVDVAIGSMAQWLRPAADGEVADLVKHTGTLAEAVDADAGIWENEAWLDGLSLRLV